MGLALAILFLWLAGIAFWIAFHKVSGEISGLPGIIGSIVSYVQTAGQAAGNTNLAALEGPGDVSGGAATGTPA